MAQVPDFFGVAGIQDHDPILVHTAPWSQQVLPEMRCAMWNCRDVTAYKKRIAALTADMPPPVSAHDCALTYTQLTSHMLTAMREVNASKAPITPVTEDPSDWASVIRQLAKQAKRRSKVFYRRVKHTLLSPPAKSTLPTPTRKIQRILQRNTPWSAHALSHVSQRPRHQDVPPPTQAALRELARASRKKSPGPDKVPPYLLHVLPDETFCLVHACVTLCYEEGTIPDDWLVSETFCLFKGKVKWQDPDRWRPIAMSKSIYRLFMRRVYSQLYPLISPHLHHRQFGGRQGISTAHATQMFLDDLHKLGPVEAILAFDVYHAFDSPPKILIRAVLDKMGTPLKLLRIITLVMERGSTFLRGAEQEIFRTTHGVKQGCPLSCFLFVVVFDIPLRVLDQHGITFSAYVDDICSPTPPKHSQHQAQLVQYALSLIACQLNVGKSESLPMLHSPTDLPLLPKYLHPPCALQASNESLWQSVTAEFPPEWSSQVNHPFVRARYIMHLGHPLAPRLCVDRALSIVLEELRSQLTELHSQWSQVLDRVLLVNTMVLPHLLYRTECIPLTVTQLHSLNSLIEKIIFGVLGLPSVVARKTLYTHRSHGLDMGYFPVLHPTRVLDTLHRNPYLHTMSTRSQHPLSPYNTFKAAIALLNPSPEAQQPPVSTTWAANKLMRDATAIVHIAGLSVYLVPSHLQPGSAYSDGSKLGSPPSAGAAVVLRDGRIAVCRVPGVPNSYKAELIGVLLGSHLSPAHENIRLDCKGAIASAQGQKRPVRQAHWVQEVRSSLSSKGQTLEWVEGHTGDTHNEAADEYAKIGTVLPLPAPLRRQHAWDVIRHGERLLPPYKVWSHDSIPSHSHDSFHPLSWRPLRFRRLAWHEWLFGLQSRMGYAHYATFWNDAPGKADCPHCHRRHNLSLHGVPAYCTPSHPLVCAWLSSWTASNLVKTWRQAACRKDLRIVGRLAVPRSL